MRTAGIVSFVLAAGLGVFFAPVAANAQVRPPGGINQASRPGVSPYVNLTRTDIAPVISYYGIILPQRSLGNSVQQLQVQQTDFANQQQQQQAFATANVLPPTGHAAGFLTQSRYFLTKGSAGGGVAAAGGQAAPIRR